jgi:hypothetical protein
MKTYLCGSAIKKLICFHKNGHGAYCKFSNNPYMIGFGILQILLSQIPNFHKLTLLSTVAAITSFGYALIGSGLSLAVVVSGIIFITFIFPKDYFQHQLHQKKLIYSDRFCDPFRDHKCRIGH